MIDTVWLRRLEPAKLEGLLQLRPECIATPKPESLGELAERLMAPWAVVEAMRRLDRPTLQAAEALAALGGSAPIPELSRLLGHPKPRHIDRALSNLHDHALLRLEPQPTLVPAAVAAWPNPLQLGPPVAGTLYHRTVEELKGIARELGIQTGTRKAEILRQVTAALQDHELIRALVDRAPKAVRDELMHSARTGEPIAIRSSYYYSSYRRSSAPMATDVWGIERAVLTLAEDMDSLTLVAEAALALRGPDYAAPFDPEPPQLSTIEADQRLADAGGVAAAAAFGNIVTALLDEAGQKPIAVLKAGGVGTRELKRLAKAVGSSEGDVRLALCVGYSSNLWAAGPAGGAPTSHYDAWLAESPAERLAELIRTLWTMPQMPLAEDGTWHPLDVPAAAALRGRLLGEIPPGAAVADPKALVAAVTWRFPYCIGDPQVAGHFLEAAWREAELAGLVAGGAVTGLGRALLAGGEGLADALAAIGSAQTTARFQADLTAVVAGTASAALLELLDTAADRESRGTASTWRFSASSVRRALDAGYTAPELLDQLSKVAVGGVPQPLRYLLQDVARQHGAVRVRSVACCLRGEDTALLERLTADRKLISLRLSLLAPTVLASAKPIDETLAALRTAGYAPVAENTDGVVVVQQRKPERATDPVPRRPARAAAQPDFAELAKTMLAGPDSVKRASATLTAIASRVEHLGAAERRLLAHAVDTKTPVTIAYVNQQGNESVRVIEDIELSGGSLYAWCRLRDDARFFNLERIIDVRPA